VYDWLLFFHVLSAALLVGAIAYFWALVIATRPGKALFGGAVSATMARPATIAISIGVAGTLIFGVWLAIYVDEYQVWDGWILASLALWAIGTGAGGQSGKALMPAGDEYPNWRRGILLHGVTSAAALLILVLMIWKPGA
jgi:hypothetical protein